MPKIDWHWHLVWLSGFLWPIFKFILKLEVKSIFYRRKKMQLSKAFDPVALISALKTAGIADAEKLVNDELPIVFDWLNSSVAMVAPAPYGMIANGVLTDLEAKAMAEIQALEAKIPA